MERARRPVVFNAATDSELVFGRCVLQQLGIEECPLAVRGRWGCCGAG